MFVALFLILAIWFYPFVAILRSKKVRGARKAVWALYAIPLSWFWYAYFLYAEK
jgi:hypothetical protein